MVAGIVLLGLVMDTLRFYFLRVGQVDAFRATQVLLNLLSHVTDLVLLFLAWMLFEALGRIEREPERIQALMDTMYRRLP